MLTANTVTAQPPAVLQSLFPYQALALSLTFTGSSETTAVPRLVSLHTKGTLRSSDQTNLESAPGATALLPLELCLGLGHAFLPRYIRRSATDERRLSEAS